MNEFRTGDVVAHPKYGRGIVQDVGWVEFGASHDDALLSDVADDLRRLVVIDPEDPEQVADALLASPALAHLIREAKAEAWDEGYRAGCDDGHDHAHGLTAGRPNPYREQDQ